MDSIDIFYQGEGIAGIEHLEFSGEATIAALKLLLAKKHGFTEDVFIFIEDEEKPSDEEKHLHQCASPAGVKVHMHRCHKIEVRVTFNNETVEHKFSPGTTVGKVKRWAAEEKFGMSPEEAGEHVLQLAGTKDRPNPGIHIGALVTRHKCEISFDLVPDERVQGYVEIGQ